jgi:peptidoglycan-N-acetylglucosamine deacetylase
MRRVTVVIPAYNEEALLPRCLRALCVQDYAGELQILVVDNASTDGTAQVARAFGVEVVAEPKRGYCNALAAGFAAATGEIIAVTDADTVPPDDWVSRLVATYDAHPDAVAVGGGLAYPDANLKSRILTDLLFPWLSRLDRIGPRGPHLWGANMSVKRDAFLAVGGWNPKFNLQTDIELCERLRRVGRVLRLDGLRVQTSSRRWKKSFLLNFFLYATNHLWFLTFRRPLWHEFPAVRELAWSEGQGTRRALRRPTAGLAGVFAIAFLIVAYGALNPRSNAFGRTYWNGATQRKVVALTFDDGPNEPYTSKILDILNREHVTATFFLVGRNVRCYPETAARIASEGHVVGNHSDSHPVGFALKSVRRLQHEVDAAETTIHSATGCYPHFFRPPNGLRSPWLMSVLAGDSLVAVTWDDTPRDWRPLPAAKLVRRALDQAHPGAIILLHDGLNLDHGIDRSQTVEALPEIIHQLRARGYTFCTVPELLGGTAYLSRWAPGSVRKSRHTERPLAALSPARSSSAKSAAASGDRTADPGPVASK